MAQNGRLPDSELGPIPGGRLRKDAAASWRRMRAKIGKETGVWICPTSSRTAYRTLDEQQYFWNLYRSGRGSLAAQPGTSNHGWGTTVDLATPAMRRAIDRFGAEFGWSKRWSDAPTEWWHIRYDPAHDKYKDKPVTQPKRDWEYLGPDEKKMRRKLMRLRREARERGGWAKVPKRRRAAEEVKTQIRQQRGKLRRAAANDGGWTKYHRRERYNALGRVLKG